MQAKYKSEIQFLSFYLKTMNVPSPGIGSLRVMLPVLFVVIQLVFQSCKKLVEISDPTSTITNSKVFSNDAVATQAMSGVYYSMVNSRDPFLFAGGMSIYTGFSSDELVLFNQTNATALQFYQNNLTSSNNQLGPRLWSGPFANLYQANAVLEGINTKNISDSVRKKLIAEVKFVRAFINFNLINLYGDIPYLTSTNWRENGLLKRTSISQVYQFIISDLIDARSTLPDDYSDAKGQRITPNKWAAVALLARTYLYTGDYMNAEIQANSIINNVSLYDTVPLNNVFLKNSKEAIWQLQQDNNAFTGTATSEGWNIIPTNNSPLAYVNTQLFNAFEANDNRKTSWLKSRLISGNNYYYPYKYKTGRIESVFGGTTTEYYMVLRLAEQYLIRAETRYKQNKLPEAIADINVIRRRAGLPLLANSLTQQQVISAIEQEKRIEFFAEWGHRWLDLKRWGQADAVLGALKGTNWQTTDQLYPIPYSEMITAPNLNQNQGY